MNEYTIQESTLISLANAIRTKSETSNPIDLAEMIAIIDGLETGMKYKSGEIIFSEDTSSHPEVTIATQTETNPDFFISYSIFDESQAESTTSGYLVNITEMTSGNGELSGGLYGNSYVWHYNKGVSAHRLPYANVGSKYNITYRYEDSELKLALVPDRPNMIYRAGVTYKWIALWGVTV